MTEFENKKPAILYNLWDSTGVKTNETEIVKLYLQYLDMLQKGRVKPDSRGGGSVHESLDNIPDIAAVKKKLNEILELDIDLIDNVKTTINQQKSKYRS